MLVATTPLYLSLKNYCEYQFESYKNFSTSYKYLLYSLAYLYTRNSNSRISQGVISQRVSCQTLITRAYHQYLYVIFIRDVQYTYRKCLTPTKTCVSVLRSSHGRKTNVRNTTKILIYSQPTLIARKRSFEGSLEIQTILWRSLLREV